NTLIFDVPIRGANTDVHGFKKLMEEAGVTKCDRPLILGAGGAAKAVLAALPHAKILARRDGSWARLPELASDADLIVDATPRGLAEDPVELPPTGAAIL